MKSIENKHGNIQFTFRENCAIKTMKQIRRLYQRPTMIPSMIELSKPNWILISQNHSESTVYKSVSSDNEISIKQFFLLDQAITKNRYRHYCADIRSNRTAIEAKVL